MKNFDDFIRQELTQEGLMEIANEINMNKTSMKSPDCFPDYPMKISDKLLLLLAPLA